MVEHGGMGGGGFMTDSPSLSQSKRSGSERVQNIVPVALSLVAGASPEEPLRVAGSEVNLAVIVGRLESVERSPVKIAYTLVPADSSSYGGSEEGVSVLALRWLDAETDSHDADNAVCSLAEGMLCRAVVSVRPARNPSAPGSAGTQAAAVRCFDIRAVSAEEACLHVLEVQHAQLKIRQHEMMASGGGSAAMGGGGGLANSLTSADTAAGQGVMGGGMGGLSAAQQLVYSVIQAARSDDGASRETIVAGVRGRVPRNEVEQVLEFLSNEGHVYNTTDDDHFKATDC